VKRWPAIRSVPPSVPLQSAREAWFPVRQVSGREGILRSAAYGLLWLFVFAMPWENSLVFEGLGQVTRVLGILTMLVGIVAVLEQGKLRRLTFGHVLVLAFVSYVSLSALWSIDVERSTLFIRTYVQVTWTAWLVWEFARDRECQTGLMNAYVAGGFVAVFLVLLDFSHARPLRHVEQRFSAQGFNPNDLAFALAIGLPLALYQASRPGHLGRRALCWAYLPVCTLGVALTGSRGGMVVGIAGIALCAPLLFRPARLQTTVAALALALAGAFFAARVVPEATIARLFSARAEVAGGDLNGREEIWREAWRSVPERPLLGAGVGAFVATDTARLSAHNTYLNLLVEDGIVGALLFLGILAYIFAAAMRVEGSEKVLWLAVLTSWAIGVTVAAWEAARPTWFLLAMALAAANRPGKGLVQPSVAPSEAPAPGARGGAWLPGRAFLASAVFRGRR